MYRPCVMTIYPMCEAGSTINGKSMRRPYVCMVEWFVSLCTERLCHASNGVLSDTEL